MRYKTRVNVILSFVAQLVVIITGLIIPRLIITTFGSATNGLISSLNQFLNYITLVEGGLGSVVLASLYKPLVEKNSQTLSSVFVTSRSFFKGIAYIYLLYSIILAAVYPFFKDTSFSWTFIFSLTIILSVNLFIQYFFSITQKLLLRADNRLYVSLIVQITTSILVFCITLLLIKIFPNIHLIKGFAALVYIAQPIIYSVYIKKNYDIDYKAEKDKDLLSERWDCFGQNTAFFIHNNTDIVVLTLFKDLLTVSVYSVHMLAINGVKSLTMTLSNVMNPLIGHSIAKQDSDEINNRLDNYEFIMSSVASVVFGCCMVLLPSFVQIYTAGVTDVDYNHKLFAVLITLAEYIYCIRDPYITIAYAAGDFKQTSNSAYLEAFINIAISLAFVKSLGLVGVAIGTLCGMSYRLLYQINYMRHNVVFRSLSKTGKRLICNLFIMGTGYLFCSFIVSSTNIINWIGSALLVLLVFVAITFVFSFLFYKSYFESIISIFLNKFRG